MKKKHLDIIDPIHNFIRVYDSELAIIDSSAFQRLRRIKQLSGAHLTYPGAQHTRFEHSLGVMHIAGLAGQLLQEKEIIGKDDVQDLRIAGLLHDIGHGPFSHLFEEIFQNHSNITHEDIGKNIILKTEIGDLLSSSGFNKKKITRLSFGESKLPFMNEIISGILSADMMDYLLRDGYFTGAEHAKIDHIRIIQSFDVYRKKLALEKSALYSFESMMHSRYQMFKAVYFHKTVRAAEVMLLEAIRLADKELNLNSMSLSEYLELTDDSILSKLLAIKSKNDRLQRAKQLAQDYLNRNLLKCVYEQIFTNKTNLSKNSINSIKKKISEQSHVPETEIFVDSSITPSIPLAPSKKESKSITLMSYENGKYKGEELPISNIPIVSIISGFMNILRIYTNQKNRKKVEIAAHSILGRKKQ